MNVKEFLTSKKYGSLSYFLCNKIPFISANWNVNYNPLYHWWKNRRYFKRPKAHFSKGLYDELCFYGFLCNENYLNKIIDVRFEALGWKSKYDSPRHEWDPYISIVFFRKWMLLWKFNWEHSEDGFSDTRSMATWEALLDMMYFKKSLEWVKEHHIWMYGIDTDSIEIKINSNLREAYQ